MINFTLVLHLILIEEVMNMNKADQKVLHLDDHLYPCFENIIFPKKIPCEEKNISKLPQAKEHSV